MRQPIDRRSFLLGSTGLLGLAATSACASGGAAAEGGKEPLFRLSLAEWSLHRSLFGRAEPHLTNLDFPRVARELGFEGCEYVNQFFKDKGTDARYLAELARICDGEGVRSLLIMCDGEGALGDPDDARRRTAVQNHHRWVDAGRRLGCHSIRVNAESSGTWDEQQKLAADGLRALTDYAAPLGLNVIVENHGGLSSNGKWLSGVMRMVGHPRCGTLPDFGNFHVGKDEDYDRYQGVAEMMPFAKAVSAKSYAFGPDGNETTIDFLRMLRVVVDAGYHGHVGVEFEGNGLSERDGILATKRLLERVRDELSA
ncbi:MAG: sugar phosphate isomerase/epimerase family protein [Planctomycetota bacterium]